MSLSILQQAMQNSWQRLDPNITPNVLGYAQAVIEAFERAEICLDLTKVNLNAIDELENSPLVGIPGEFKPLIKDGNYLYLARYHGYQTQLVQQLLARIQIKFEPNFEQLETILAQVFAEQIDLNDLQFKAVKTALINNFSIIAGGPGTGKTTTMVKILVALLLENPNLKIGLAAPTGKAAARMSEAILKALPKFRLSDELKQAFAIKAQTLHRLLGSFANSSKTFRNQDNQLNLDVLIVDEASMLDLALMAKLLNALSFDTRLILLGDSYQLSAVEAGSVFGDLCLAQTKLSKVTTHLKVSHRFKDTSQIGQFVSAVKNGDCRQALSLIINDKNWIEQLSVSDLNFRNLKSYLIEQYQSFITCAQNLGDLTAIFSEFAKFRALCSHNEGKFGANYLNKELDFYFRNNAHNVIDNWYPGRAVLILRNDYNLQLFNGDIGICLPDNLLEKKAEQSSEQSFDHKFNLRVFFESEEGFRSFSVHRLPEFTEAFVLTVHKSQGSEFDQVAVILPNSQSELISRSMLYTAVTRAKSLVKIWADLAQVEYAINNCSQSLSSLAHKLS